ncbi:MAG: small metal-binding protein SmbP [Methylomonas sp.]
MKKLASLLLSGTLALFLSTGVFAEEHATEALEHANGAVTAGKGGDANKLVEHAQMALEHAEKGEKVVKGEPKKHMEEAVKSLKSAIEHGKMGHADMATKAAEEAVKHLEAGNVAK